jgi:hypothetical protein
VADRIVERLKRFPASDHGLSEATNPELESLLSLLFALPGIDSLSGQTRRLVYDGVDRTLKRMAATAVDKASGELLAASPPIPTAELEKELEGVRRENTFVRAMRVFALKIKRGGQATGEARQSFASLVPSPYPQHSTPVGVQVEAQEDENEEETEEEKEETEEDEKEVEIEEENEETEEDDKEEDDQKEEEDENGEVEEDEEEGGEEEDAEEEEHEDQEGER